MFWSYGYALVLVVYLIVAMRSGAVIGLSVPLILSAIVPLSLVSLGASEIVLWIGMIAPLALTLASMLILAFVEARSK